MKNTLHGVVLLSLMALLIGCETSETQIIRVPVETTVIEKVQVPAELVQRCPEPDLDSLTTTGDIEDALGEAIVSLQTCNQDKERIAAWQEEDL